MERLAPSARPFQNEPQGEKRCGSVPRARRGVVLVRHVADVACATWHVRSGSLDLTVDSEGKPLIECNDGMLVCLSKGDSTRVMNVSGTYNPLTGRFYGRNGALNWERTTNSETFDVELGAFEIR